MGRLNLQFAHMRGQMAWELRRGASRAMRRFGRFGLVMLALALVSLIAWALQRQQRALAEQTQVSLADRLAQRQLNVQPVNAGRTDGQARLKAFDEFLLPNEDIPTVIQDLINLAERENLTLARGEYRPQPDVQGGFLRYRMTLPVKGDAQAIRRFMQAALRSNKTLALESVQFKRERIESTEVEARLQWVVMTRSPSAWLAADALPETMQPKVLAR